MTVVAIHQPNYLPWMGFFFKAINSHVLVLNDTVQFEKGSYTNRARIKSSQAVQWLTQPVVMSGRAYQEIRAVEFARRNWPPTHLKTIQTCYGRAPHFQPYFDQLRELLHDVGPDMARCNERLIVWMLKVLGSTTPVVRASELGSGGADPTQRLIHLVRAVGGDAYLSGKGGFNYQDLHAFERAGVRVLRSRSAFSEYPQLWNGFVHGLSIVDLLFNCGPTSRTYLDAPASGLAEAVPTETARS